MEFYHLSNTSFVYHSKSRQEHEAKQLKHNVGHQELKKVSKN